MKVYKKVIQVDFVCSYYMRLAHLQYEPDMEEVVCAKPLWMDSNWNIIQDNNPPHSFMLRWFAAPDLDAEVQLDSILTLPVEISYLSKRLDREEKFESLGIKE